MWGWIGLAVVALLILGAGLWLALVVSLRTKYRPGIDVIRTLNRRFTNPRVLRSAGEPGAAASVIDHVGRTSGRSYRTPVGVVDTGDEFVITLPYGTRPDWLKNVRAAGVAVLTTEGQAHQVADPRIVTSSELDYHFSRRERLTHWIYGADEFLVLTRVPADAPTAAHVEAHQ